MVSIIIPEIIKLGAHSYRLSFDPHLWQDEDKSGLTHHRLQEINIELAVPPSNRDETLLHEVLHIIDLLYRCRLNEDDIERLAQGLADFLFNNLEITLDWSNIPVKQR